MRDAKVTKKKEEGESDEEGYLMPVARAFVLVLRD